MIQVRAEYVGIRLERLNAFEDLLEKFVETNPELGKELFNEWRDLGIFNIPILRSKNGIDFELETDSGHFVGRGKFLDCLKTVDMESMDYYLNEELPDEEVAVDTAKLDLLAKLDVNNNVPGRIRRENDSSIDELKAVEIDKIAFDLLEDKCDEISADTGRIIPVGIVAELLIKRHMHTEEFNISEVDNRK